MRVRAAGVIIKDNQILLMHRRKNGQEYWVVPGGKVEEGETSDQAVKREIKEELNLDVTRCEKSFETEDPISRTIFFRCEISEGNPQLGGPELSRNSPSNWYQPEWVSLESLPKLKFFPTDAKPHLVS